MADVVILRSQLWASIFQKYYLILFERNESPFLPMSLVPISITISCCSPSPLQMSLVPRHPWPWHKEGQASLEWLWNERPFTMARQDWTLPRCSTQLGVMPLSWLLLLFAPERPSPPKVCKMAYLIKMKKATTCLALPQSLAEPLVWPPPWNDWNYLISHLLHRYYWSRVFSEFLFLIYSIHSLSLSMKSEI